MRCCAARWPGERHATTSTAVLEELWHLELRGRPPGLAGVTRLAYRLMTPLLAVDDSTVALALDLDEIPALAANGRIHLATCRLHGIGLIVSADAEFDDLEGLRRVDPQAEDALGRLGLTPHPPGARA
ncbi:MAG: type II toxin-antitoxin system VapC family toxin [Egibacteraceae bacterium]